jgi:HPt (histidine-containing phosphotransfer) domain-containing protein
VTAGGGAQRAGRAGAGAREHPPAPTGGPGRAAQAFAGELAERLPRLRASVEDGDDALLREAVRDAHALGSSAAVVGEADASRSARAAEALLLARPAGAPVPAGLREHVDALSARLDGWRP